jgi:hypothetical protein
MNSIVLGSVGQIALRQNTSMAQVLMGAKLLVAVDVSSSMTEKDAGWGLSRYEAAVEKLKEIQDKNPGQVAVISFNTEAVFCPYGIPEKPNGGTSYWPVLEMLLPFDGTDIEIAFISDGQPLGEEEEDIIKFCRKFTTKINTIYVGPDDPEASGLLARMAKATGGSATVLKNTQIPQLGIVLKGLLPPG